MHIDNIIKKYYSQLIGGTLVCIVACYFIIQNAIIFFNSLVADGECLFARNLWYVEIFLVIFFLYVFFKKINHERKGPAVEIILFLVIPLFLFSNMISKNIGSAGFDETILVSISKALSSAKLYYKDVIHVSPPLSHWVSAFFMRIFKGPVFASRLLQVAILSFNAFLFYMIAKQRKTHKHLIYFMLLAFVYKMQPLLYWYSYNSLGLLFSFSAMLLFLLFLDTQHLKYIFISGLFLGLLVLTKQSTAFLSFTSISLFIILYKKKEFCKYILVLFAGALVPILPFCLVLLKQGLLNIAIVKYFSIFFTSYLHDTMSYFGKYGATTEGGYWFWLYMTPLATIGLYLILSGYFYFKKKNIYFINNCIFVFCTIGFFSCIYPRGDVHHFSYGFIYICMIIILIFNILRTERTRIEISRFEVSTDDLIATFIILLSAFMYIIPYYLSLVFISILIMGKILRFRRHIPNLSQYFKPKYSILILCFILFSQMSFSIIKDIYQISGRVYYENIFISQSQFKLIKDLQNELGNFKQQVYQVLPNPLIYIIGNYENPTRFFAADAVDIGPQERKEIINTLKGKKVKTVVVNMKDIKELNHPQNIHHKKIMEFVESGYDFEKTVGSTCRIYKWKNRN